MSQIINVDMTPGLFMPTLYFSQDDVGRAFTIKLASRDGTEVPSGATVKIQATKPSGFGFSVAGTLSDGVATFSATQVMTDEYGRFPAEIEITSGNTVLGTANFWMQVEKNPHPEGTTDGSQETIIPELTLLIERAEAAAETAATDAAAAAESRINELMDYLPDEVNALELNSMKFTPRDTSVTSSKMLKTIGCYNISTSWYADLSDDFGASKIGSMIVFGNPVNSQLFQLLYFETGVMYARWVHKSADTAGVWHPVYTDQSELLAYKANRDVTTTNLLTKIGYYHINSSWYTDLQSIFGENLLCSLVVFGHVTNKKIQFLCTENGCMYVRGVTSAGVADSWRVIKQSIPYMREGKYIAFGDSRCYGLLASSGGQSEYRYPKYIANAKGMSYANMGVSGSGLFADDTHEAALTTIQSTDISDATLITIEYGVNDWEHPIGAYTDTGDTTFCGKLYRVIKYITETNPNAALVVIGSANTAEGVQSSSWGYGFTTSAGWSLGALIDEEARLCAKYHVPFISGYDDPFNDFNIAELMPDEIHFADQGYHMRSMYLLGKINALYAE